MKKKILLVEDDQNLGFVIKDNLGIKGFDVTWCRDGQEGWQTFSETSVDLCILDVMLPKKDGFTLAQEIRNSNTSIPILFLTAKSMLEDKLEGFKSGADDYICKPFSMEELICRMDVFLRRGNQSLEKIDNPVCVMGDFEFNTINLTLTHNAAGQKTLTSKEAAVLQLLYANRHRVLKREEILKHIWGDDDYFIGRSLDVFISKLRKYLKDDPSIQITNYHGVGFRLEIRSLHE